MVAPARTLALVDFREHWGPLKGAGEDEEEGARGERTPLRSAAGLEGLDALERAA